MAVETAAGGASSKDSTGGSATGSGRAWRRAATGAGADFDCACGTGAGAAGFRGAGPTSTAAHSAETIPAALNVSQLPGRVVAGAAIGIAPDDDGTDSDGVHNPPSSQPRL